MIFGAAVRPDGSPSPTLRLRVEAAAAFGGQHNPSHYIPTGAKGRYGPSEARVMADLLQDFGVPQERITLEETATNTLRSALAAARLLRQLSQSRNGKIYAASSLYHLPRCCLLLRLAGCPARPVPPPQANSPQAYGWLREAAALPVDVLIILLVRFWPPLAALLGYVPDRK